MKLEVLTRPEPRPLRSYDAELDNILSVLADVCRELERQRCATFSVAANGVQVPVTVERDLCVWMEQAPRVVRSLEDREDCQIALYEQGVELFVDVSFREGRCFVSAMRYDNSVNVRDVEIDPVALARSLRASVWTFVELMTSVFPEVARHVWVMNWLAPVKVSATEDELFETMARYPLASEFEREVPAIVSGERKLFVDVVPRQCWQEWKERVYDTICERALELGLCVTTMAETSLGSNAELVYVFVSRYEQLWRVPSFVEVYRATMSGCHRGVEIEARLRGVSFEDIERGSRWSESASIGSHLVLVTSREQCQQHLQQRHHGLSTSMQGLIAFVPRPHLLRSRQELQRLDVGVIRCESGREVLDATFPDHRSITSVQMRPLSEQDVVAINSDPQTRISVLTDDGWTC